MFYLAVLEDMCTISIRAQIEDPGYDLISLIHTVQINFPVIRFASGSLSSHIRIHRIYQKFALILVQGDIIDVDVLEFYISTLSTVPSMHRIPTAHAYP